VDPTVHRAYVANYGGASVTVIDTTTNVVVGTSELSSGRPVNPGEHAIRGGSWEDYAGDNRAAARVGAFTDDAFPSDGIRVVRMAE
jgi:YVTN family beta-propeller protein